MEKRTASIGERRSAQMRSHLSGYEQQFIGATACGTQNGS